MNSFNSLGGKNKLKLIMILITPRKTEKNAILFESFIILLFLY